MQQTQLHQQAVPQRTRRLPKWLPYALLGGGGFVAMAMAACAFTLLLVYAAVDRIPNGVSVAGVDIGGETVEAAVAQLQDLLVDQPITLVDQDRMQDLMLSDLGITVNFAQTLEQAESAAPNSDLTPQYHVDLVKTQEALVNLSEKFNYEPVDETPGRSLEIPVLLDRLRTNTLSEIADGIIELPMIEIEPPEPEVITAENYTGEKTIHVVERGQELGLIAKQYNVPVNELTSLNGITNPDLLYIGQELLIPVGGEYMPSAADAPAPSTTVGKALVVSVSTQRIYAYENGNLVNSHLVSTGLPDTPTVLGDYNIYVKYTADDMSGPDYFLPQVPWTMYFYQGYAIHGTYWHNAFGRPMSHGCVNLPVEEANWFYNFAQVGTPVRVVA